MNGIENITKRIAEEAEVSAREIIAAAEAEVRAMLSGFTVLRMTSMIGMVGLTFNKEELLKMNKKLNRIKKPKNKKK